MNMKAKKRIICACEEVGFEKYNVMITVPKEHPFGKKGLFDCDIDVSWAIAYDKVWRISFSRETLGKAIDDSVVVTEYLDDMLESSKIVDQHDLLGALVTDVDRLGDDSWKITFRLKGGDVVEMFGDDEDHFIIYGTDKREDDNTYNSEDDNTYNMMMKLADDIEYYSDRISHERMWRIRDRLQKIEEIFNIEYAKDVNDMMLASDAQ